MAVLDEIRSWMAARAKWENHAFELIYQTPVPSDEGINDLVQKCIDEVGAVRPKASSKKQASNATAETPNPKVVLLSVADVTNINSLAPEQSLNFESTGLTVVYGDNGSGKTGYNRILKQVCRVRGKKVDLLGNVYEAQSGPAAATIRFSIDGAEQPSSTYSKESPAPSSLAQISIFDSKVATVQVQDSNEVSFRPFGLDLIDHLVKAMERVKEKLRDQINAVANSTFDATPFTDATDIFTIVSALSAKDAAQKIEPLAFPLTEVDEARILQLESIIAEAKANDPKTLAATCKAKRDRFSLFQARIAAINKACGEENLARIKGLKEAATQAATASDEYRVKVMHGQPLEGVGTTTWQAMWNAAKAYSQKSAYPKVEYPVLNAGAKCVLCAQDLSTDAKNRFQALDQFVKGELQKQATQSNEAVATEKKEIEAWVFSKAEDTALFKEIETLDAKCEVALKQGIADSVKLKTCVLGYLNGIEHIPAAIKIDETAFLSICDFIAQKLTQLEATAAAGNVDKEKTELNGLKGRKLLVSQKKAILAEIERIKKHAKLQEARNSINTNGATLLGSMLTTKYVSEELKKTFEEEKLKLGISLPLKLADAGARRGVPMQRLELACSQKANIDEVISEGEHRCIALAAFLTEVSTTASGLIFDDPVCSLDHNWRESIARRLVEEAIKRQVVVFTHDIVFLVALKDVAEELAVQAAYRSIEKRGANAGYCEEMLPWKAQRIKARIGKLRTEMVVLTKAYKSGSKTYEKDIRYWYGMLREAWERAVEEALLGGAVERFRKSIKTQKLKAALANIKANDYSIIDGGMGRCSTFLPGHDKAPAQNFPVPTPTDAENDLRIISDWVDSKKI